MDTVAEVLPQIAAWCGESGTCPEDVDILLPALNDARSLLWNKVQNSATCDYICIKCFGDCIYLPSAYKSVILAWMGDEAISLGNEWYQSLPGLGHTRYGNNGTWGANTYRNSCHSKISETGGYHAVFQNYDHPYYIAVQTENNSDTGVEITVEGVDTLDTVRKQTLTTKVSPIKVRTTRKFKSVVSVVKPKTKGRIRLYAVDCADPSKYMLLAIYQPYDVNPNFLKMSVAGKKCPTMTLYVKRKFNTLDSLTDLVEFPVEALQFACQANTSKRSKNNAGFLENLNLAVEEINRETADREVPTASPLRLLHQDNVINLL